MWTGSVDETHHMSLGVRPERFGEGRMSDDGHS